VEVLLLLLLEGFELVRRDAGSDFFVSLLLAAGLDPFLARLTDEIGSTTLRLALVIGVLLTGRREIGSDLAGTLPGRLRDAAETEDSLLLDWLAAPVFSFSCVLTFIFILSFSLSTCSACFIISRKFNFFTGAFTGADDAGACKEADAEGFAVALLLLLLPLTVDGFFGVFAVDEAWFDGRAAFNRSIRFRCSSCSRGVKDVLTCGREDNACLFAATGFAGAVEPFWGVVEAVMVLAVVDVAETGFSPFLVVAVSWPVLETILSICENMLYICSYARCCVINK
jgi:hypothetical protein